LPYLAFKEVFSIEKGANQALFSISAAKVRVGQLSANLKCKIVRGKTELTF